MFNGFWQKMNFVSIYKYRAEYKAGFEGSTQSGCTYPNDFSDSRDQDIRAQCALSWKIMVSEWRSVIAVSPNIGGGVRLIKPAKLYMCTQKHYNHNQDGHPAPGVYGHGSVPQSHLENVLTKIGLQQQWADLETKCFEGTAR